MKICVISKGYSPYSLGGADVQAEKIANEFAKRNNSIVVITINPSRGEVIDLDGNTKIYRIRPFNVSTFHRIGRESFIKQGIWTLLDIYSHHSYTKIRDILQREEPDVVHIHSLADMTLSAVNAVKDLGLPLVYTLHDYFMLCRRFVLLHGFKTICTDEDVNPLCKVYREFTKRIIKNKIDMVVAPSKFVLDMHKKYGIFDNSRAVVLPNGIELSDIDNTKKIETFTTNGKTTNILYTGGLTRHKGVHILISAFKLIKNKNIKLHITGGGVYKSDLEYLGGDDKRIVFYGRLPSYKDVQAFYNKADVTVVPSIWHDVSPAVILEAFRAGTPVIGSNIGGIPELIKDNYNGFLFEAGNIERLREILYNVIKNPDILKELGRNAQESIKEFEMSKYIQKLSNIYEDVIKINKIK